MNKRRTTRKKSTQYKIPFKSEIGSQQDDSKIVIEEKSHTTSNASSKAENKTISENCKPDMHQKITRRSSRQKKKEIIIRGLSRQKKEIIMRLSSRQKKKEVNERCLKYENANAEASNSGSFQETTTSNKKDKINVSFKADEDKTVTFPKVNYGKVSNSNGYSNAEANNYKLNDDVYLVVNEIISNIIEEERKQENSFPNQNNTLQAEGNSAAITENTHDLIYLQENFPIKAKNDERNPKESNKEEEMDNRNYIENKNDFKCPAESAGFKIVDVDNIKRKIGDEEDEVNEFVFKNSNYKKQKINNNTSHGERKCVKENNDDYQTRRDDSVSFFKIQNESMSSSELTVETCTSKNYNSKENQTIGDSNNPNPEDKISCNLNSRKKDENISLQEIINPTEQFTENFIDLKSDSASLHGSLNTKPVKKTLTIPCMSALDYFNTLKVTENEDSTEIDENSKLSKKINPPNTGNLHTDKFSELKKGLNGGEIAKQANEKNDKNSTSHKITTFIKEVPKCEYMNLKTSFTETETNNNLDKTELQNLYPSNLKNSVSSDRDFKTLKNSDIGFSIFSEEEFIAEKIIFREKEENDNIPTGVFKHLNEIFEYNNATTSIDLKYSTQTKTDSETISIDLKCITPLKLDGFVTDETNNETALIDSNKYKPIKLDNFLTEETLKDPRKYENSIEELKMLKATPATDMMDFSKPISENLLEQANLKMKQFTDVVLNKNEEKNDKKVNFYNLENTVQENSNNVKVRYVEKTLKLGDGTDNFKPNVERNDTIERIETSTNKAEKLPEEQSFTQSETNTEKYFSDFDNSMEMDDDFNLTASQLNMLDADEHMQSTNKIDAGQQTDICGSLYMKYDRPSLEIVEELRSLRESIECLKEKLDQLISNKETIS